MTEEASSLPLDFLTRPGPTISASRIDFNDTPLSEYKDLYATVLDGVLSEEECRTLVAAAEAHNDGMWEPATINHGGGRQELALESRNCGRIMWDCPELAERLLARVTGWIPELQALDKWPKLTGNRAAMRGEVWKLSRLNERMRFLRYGPGQYFSAHCDGSYTLSGTAEKAYITLHLYLNDSSMEAAEGKLEGGSTTFHSLNMKERLDVAPKAGRILIFQHNFLLHSGDEVKSGTKFTMRTDFLYAKAEQ